MAVGAARLVEDSRETVDLDNVPSKSWHSPAPEQSLSLLCGCARGCCPSLVGSLKLSRIFRLISLQAQSCHSNRSSYQSRGVPAKSMGGPRQTDPLCKALGKAPGKFAKRSCASHKILGSYRILFEAVKYLTFMLMARLERSSSLVRSRLHFITWYPARPLPFSNRNRRSCQPVRPAHWKLSCRSRIVFVARES